MCLCTRLRKHFVKQEKISMWLALSPPPSSPSPPPPTLPPPPALPRRLGSETQHLGEGCSVPAEGGRRLHTNGVQGSGVQHSCVVNIILGVWPEPTRQHPLHCDICTLFLANFNLKKTTQKGTPPSSSPDGPKIRTHVH